MIRYITRAGVRVETRNHLFAMIVELMQGGSKEDRSKKDMPKDDRNPVPPSPHAKFKA